MRLARLTFVLLLVLAAPRAFAQVSCANPDNLCTGDPCTITTIQVQSPCVVDFGARDLVIAGTIDVPDSGTLDFTADTILMQGRIDGRHVGNGTGGGASITLTSTVGDIELRGGIDVTATAANGSIDVTAAGNLLVKDSLNAKTSGSNITAGGGVISLVAGGTIQTDQTAVLDAQGADNAGGSIGVSGGGNVTVKGRVRTEGSPAGTIGISSATGNVSVEKDLRVGSEQGDAGLIVVSANTGITLVDPLRATSSFGNGGDVMLTTATGNVTIGDQIRTNGGGTGNGGSITIDAPNGTVGPQKRLDVRGETAAGSVDIQAATINLTANIDARADNGGTVQLEATGTLAVFGSKVTTAGKVNGGTIALLGDAASGNVLVDKSTLSAKGSTGAGGTVTVSAPAGTVDVLTVTVVLTAKNALAGTAQIDGVALTVGPKARFQGRDNGEVRFEQSGAGLFKLNGTFDVQDGGVVEALAPAGSLTVIGKVATDGGCAGFSAGGTLDTTQLASDTIITPTCP